MIFFPDISQWCVQGHSDDDVMKSNKEKVNVILKWLQQMWRLQQLTNTSCQPFQNKKVYLQAVTTGEKRTHTSLFTLFVFIISQFFSFRSETEFYSSRVSCKCGYMKWILLYRNQLLMTIKPIRSPTVVLLYIRPSLLQDFIWMFYSLSWCWCFYGASQLF